MAAKRSTPAHRNRNCAYAIEDLGVERCGRFARLLSQTYKACRTAPPKLQAHLNKSAVKKAQSCGFSSAGLEGSKRRRRR